MLEIRYICIDMLYHRMSTQGVNIQDARGNTSLHWAAGRGLYEECVRLIEIEGADYSIFNDAKLRPVDLALNMGEQDLDNTIYDKIVNYLGKVEREKTGCNETYYFSRDYYKLFDKSQVILPTLKRTTQRSENS